MEERAEQRRGAPGKRSEQKQRTHEALLEAALRLMSGGRSFTSLGLREIAREAGVVPTAYYRHFRTLDELGLALVEAGGATLRNLLRGVRKTGLPLTDILRQSVLIYEKHVVEHRLHFMFIASERGGGSPLIRRAIRAEESHFVNEMAQDMRELGMMPQLSTPTLQMVCRLVVNTMLNAATDILDLPQGQPRLREELVENFVRQLRLIFLGASVWKDRP